MIFFSQACEVCDSLRGTNYDSLRGTSYDSFLSKKIVYEEYPVDSFQLYMSTSLCPIRQELH